MTFEKFDLRKGQIIMRGKLHCGLVIALSLASSLARADTLELVNGSLIQGKFIGGTESEISFQVGSSVQKYRVPDITAIKFDSHGVASAMPMGYTRRRMSPFRQERILLCAPSIASTLLRIRSGIDSRVRWKNR